MRLLAGPPGAKDHHDGERSEDGEKRAQKLVAFGNVAEEYVKRGHLLGVLISHPALGRDCESFRNRNLAPAFMGVKRGAVETIARPGFQARASADGPGSVLRSSATPSVERRAWR